MSSKQSKVSSPYGHRDKRQKSRVLIACTPCRSRKTRCDGNRPFCSSCTSRMIQNQCIFVPEGEERPERFEHEYTSQRSKLQGNSLYQTRNVALLNPEQHTPEGIFGLMSHETTNHHTFVDNSNESDEIICGLPSTTAFIKHVIDATSPRSNSPQPTATASKVGEDRISRSNEMPLATESSSSWDMSAMVLPERKLADNLMECFWNFIHPIFPVIHWPTLHESYKQLWNPKQSRKPIAQNETMEKPILYAILNIVFALGCQDCEDLEYQQRIHLADQFYNRSRRLVPLDTLDKYSLPILQVLLLTGIYLQSTRYGNRCWNVMGIAFRVAQGLGLHLDRSKTANETQLDREMRRRVWYVCVMADRMTATTFGRPTTFSNIWSVPLPEAIDDKYLSTTTRGLQPTNVKSRMEYFVHSIKIFDILYDVLCMLYSLDESNTRAPLSDKAETTHQQRFSNSLALNSRLDNFLNALPAHLKVPGGPSNDASGCFHMQAQTLYCRSLYIRILILRPWLLRSGKRGITDLEYGDPQYLSGLEESLSIDMGRICVSTAHKIIESLHGHLRSTYRSPSWHAVYFSFAAVTVLIAAALCPQLEIDLSSDSVNASWDRAIEVIDYNKVQLQAVPRGIEALQEFRRRISAAKDQSTPIARENTTSIETIPESTESSSEQAPEIMSDWRDIMDLSYFNPTSSDPLDDSWFWSQTINFDGLE